MFAYEIDASVFGAVVDYQDFRVGDAGGGFDDRREVFRQKILAIPVRDDYGDGLVRWLRRGSIPAAEEQPEEIGENERNEGCDHEERRKY